VNKTEKVASIIHSICLRGGVGLESTVQEVLKLYTSADIDDRDIMELALLIRECVDAPKDDYENKLKKVYDFINQFDTEHTTNKNPSFYEGSEGLIGFDPAYPVMPSSLINLSDITDIRDVYTTIHVKKYQEMGSIRPAFLNSCMLYSMKEGSFIPYDEDSLSKKCHGKLSCGMNQQACLPAGFDVSKQLKFQANRTLNHGEEKFFFEVLDTFNNLKDKENFYSLFKENPDKSIKGGDIFGFLVDLKYSIRTYYGPTQSELYLVPEKFYHEDLELFLAKQSSLTYYNSVSFGKGKINIMGSIFMSSRNVEDGTIYAIIDLRPNTLVLERFDNSNIYYDEESILTTHYYNRYYNFIVNPAEFKLIKFSYTHENKPYNPMDREVL